MTFSDIGSIASIAGVVLAILFWLFPREKK